MKVLVFGKDSPDYMQDDLYHGLMQLPDVEIESNVNLSYLFDDYPHDIKQLYGCGISYARNLDAKKRHVVDAREIIGKIAGNYYDAVIYLSIARCSDLFDFVSDALALNRIALVDGEDDQRIRGICGCVNFKRELVHKPLDDLHPISFAIPADRILAERPEKSFNLSPTAPTFDRVYKYDNERDYYDSYRRSRYALTFKKSGWDCKRHYEILANRCVPVFQDIKNCPEWTCTTLPKKLLAHIDRWWMTATIRDFESWESELHSWSDKLTTERLAHYVLATISNQGGL